jgi:hypothetical protein
MAKLHLRVEHAEDDWTIQQMLDATGAYLESIGVAMADPIPAPVVSAQLLLVARLYTNRGDGIGADIRDDPTWLMLIRPYREVVL